ARAEAMTGGLQLRAQRLKVVELTVADEPERFVFVGDGLMTAREIDDGKPAHADDGAAACVHALIVGTPMHDRVGRAAHGLQRTRRIASGMSQSDNSTHWEEGSVFFITLSDRALHTRRPWSQSRVRGDSSPRAGRSSWPPRAAASARALQPPCTSD